MTDTVTAPIAAPEQAELSHERVVLQRGPRSGLPIIVAVHSTRLGSAVGGTRMWTYPDWRDGLADALRLSAAMSLKNAAGGLDHGGGKAVIALPPGTVLTEEQRQAVMRDLGDVVDSLGGSFIVGEDVGTTGADMLVVREQTPWAGGLPESAGGSGEPSEPTAAGVYSAVVATARHLFGTAELQGRRACIIGLGQVGSRLARRLRAAGAELTVTDIFPERQRLADELGAAWVDPDEALFSDTDLLIPCALGGILRADTIDRLRCRAVVGAANNQLVDDTIADRLHERGILWAPDFIVNAGGVTFAVAVSLDGHTVGDAQARVEAIGDRLEAILIRAEQAGVPPLRIALADANARLQPARG